MSEYNWRPRSMPSGTVAQLAGMASPDTYLRFDDYSECPCSFGEHLGVDFLTGVVAATTIPSGQWALGTRNAPDPTLFMIKLFRYCEHDGTPHFNADNWIVWRDAEGSEWQMSSKEGGDHYREALTGTGLESLSGDFAFPPGYNGSISDFGTGSVCLDIRKITPDLIRAAGEK